MITLWTFTPFLMYVGSARCQQDGGMYREGKKVGWEEKRHAVQHSQSRQGVDVEIRIEAGRRRAPRAAPRAQRSMHPRSTFAVATIAVASASATATVIAIASLVNFSRRFPHDLGQRDL